MYRFAATCLISLLLALSVRGQGPRHDASFFVDTHPILRVSNAASLSLFDEPCVALANVSFQKENGRLIPLEGSDDAWKAGIGAEAFRNISDRLSFHGKLSYSHFRGENMGGQVLMNPSYNPINFLEEDFSTKGDKKRDTYILAGGLSYRLSKVVSLGVATDYTSADQVKYKDPRFQNVWMDLSVRPGVLIKLSDRFHLGVNLEYRETLEKISAKLFGSVDRDYSILVDQGNFYGPQERFEGDAGYISVNNERLLSHSFYGLAVQAIAKYGVSSYCGELKAHFHQGYFGNRSSRSVVFCEFKGPVVEYQGTFLHPKGKDLHKMKVEASFSQLTNYTNLYRHEAQVGMVEEIVYLGQNETNASTEFDATGRYSFYKDDSGYLPQWELNASAGVSGRMKQTKLYPFHRDWNVFNIHLSARGGRHLAKGRNIYSCLASASFLTGFGAPREDTMAGGASTTLRSFDNYSDRQFEYETASRLGIGLELQYTRKVSETFIPYVKLSEQFLHLLEAPQYLDGASRNIACISLGCQF